MVVLMTNDSVSVYDISEQEFDGLLSQGFITKDNLHLDKHKVYEILKAGYTPSKLQQQLGDMLVGVNAYYYDNGSFICKKDAASIDEITYYEDENGGLWASQEYEQAMHNGVKISLKQIELTSLDNRLNRYSHIQNLLPPSLISEFKRLYDGEAFIQARKAEFSHCDSPYVINSFYEVASVSKLIIRKNNKKLTAAGLDGNVFLTVAKAGINDAGETKYFVEEYRITKQDVPEINSLFRKYLKEDKVKVDVLTEEERFLYLDRAVREYRKKLIGELEGVSSKARTIVSDTTWTWNAYKAAFLAKFGYPTVELDDSWAPFDQTTIDARTIHNGYIIPITIESYQRDASSLQNNIAKARPLMAIPDVQRKERLSARFITTNQPDDDPTWDNDNVPKNINSFVTDNSFKSICRRKIIATLDTIEAKYHMPLDKVLNSQEKPDIAKEDDTTAPNLGDLEPDVGEILPKASKVKDDIQDLIQEIQDNFSQIMNDLSVLRTDFTPQLYESILNIDAGYPAEFISTVQDTLTDISQIAERFRSYHNSFLVTIEQVSQTDRPFILQKLKNMLNSTLRIADEIKTQKARVDFIKEIVAEKENEMSDKMDDNLNDEPSLEDIKYNGTISHLEGEDFVSGPSNGVINRLKM